MADPDFGAFVRTLGDDPRRVECAQIQRIYGGDTDAQLVVKGDSDVASLTASTAAASTIVVSLRFLPLDTDFPPNAFPVDNRLGLRFELGPDYPAHAPPAVTVLPMLAEPAAPPRPLWEPAASGTDGGGSEGHAADGREEDAAILHKAVSTAVDMFVQSRGGRPCVLATLRWLDKNLVAVLETATFLQQQRRGRLRQAASLSKPPPGTSGAAGGGAGAGDEGKAGGGGQLPTASACATVEPQRSSAPSDSAPTKALNPAATAFQPPAPQRQQQQQQQRRRQPPHDRLRQQRRKQQQQSRQQPLKQKPATAQKRRTPKQQPPQQQTPQQQQQRRRRPPVAGAAEHKVPVHGAQPRLQQRRKRPPGAAADAGGAGDADSNPTGGDRGSGAASPVAPATTALAEETSCKWTPRLHAKFEEALRRFWVWTTPLHKQQPQRPSSQSSSLSPGSEVTWRRRGDMQARWQTIAQATGGGVTAFDCVRRYREVRAALFKRQQQLAADGLVSEDSEAEDEAEEVAEDEEERGGGGGGGAGGGHTHDDVMTSVLGVGTLKEDVPADSSCAADSLSDDEMLRPVLSSAATAGRGVRVSLVNAQSTGLALVQCAGLALQVKCGRCGADDVVRFAARMTSATSKSRERAGGGGGGGGSDGGAAAAPAAQGIPGCRRCGYSSGCRVDFEAAAVALGDCVGGGGGGAAAPQAPHRNTLAFLRLREGRSLGVNIVGLAEASLLATCESCGGEELLDKVRMDHGIMGFCARCHEKRGLSVTDGVKFLSIGLWAAGAAPYTATAAASAALKNKARQNSRKLKKQRQEFGGHGVVKGSPLPNNGACKHYGRSRRWYRFPCCGLLFPCDECHAEARVVSKATAASAAILDDSNVCERDARANKMVCGLCSTEQGLAKSCKSCKCDVTGSSAGKVFWEGGVGQRDAAKRSNKDPTKMRGRNKTVSRKKALQGKNKH